MRRLLLPLFSMIVFAALAAGLFLASAQIAAADDSGNIVLNGDMELDANRDRMPDYWEAILDPGFPLTKKEGIKCRNHNCRLVLTGRGLGYGERYVRQIIPHVGVGGETFTFTASSRAKNVPVYGAYHVMVLFGDHGELDNQFVYPFEPGTHGWQTVTETVNSLGSYDTIIIWIRFQKESGKAWFDDISLVPAD
jgi:hypothetical protein